MFERQTVKDTQFSVPPTIALPLPVEISDPFKVNWFRIATY